MTIKHVIPKHLESISAKLIEMGAEIEELDDAVRVVATKRLSPTNGEDNALSRDSRQIWQSQIAVCLSLADGTSPCYREDFREQI